MLKKLLKHELRATGRIMLPMFLLVLVSAVFANLSTRFLLETDHDFLNLLGILLHHLRVKTNSGLSAQTFTAKFQ